MAKKQNDAEALKSVKDVLAYAADAGRKLAKSKVYEDIKAGELLKQPNGTFLLKHVEKYLLSLPMLGHSESFADDAEKRQRRKEMANIRRAEADAALAEFNLEKQKGVYVRRDEMLVELAGRAVALREGLKSAFESSMPELVEAVGGDALKVPALRMVLERTLDEAMGEYAKPMTFEVELGGFDMEEEA